MTLPNSCLIKCNTVVESFPPDQAVELGSNLQNTVKKIENGK